MKKTYFFSLTIAVSMWSFTAQAQIYSPSGDVDFSQVNNSSIGIGTDIPESKLHILGSEDELLLIEAEARAIVNGWQSPKNSLRVVGMSETQQQGGPPNFETVFNIDESGSTMIGEFDFNVPDFNKLLVKRAMGVYASQNAWMRFRFGGGGPNPNNPMLTWRAPGDRYFRLGNDETGTVALTLSKNGEVGAGTSAFTGDHSFYVEGTAVSDMLYIQEPSEWGQDNDFIEIKHSFGPEIRWKSSSGENFRFFSNGNNVMHLSPEGKVGIGTDNFVNDYSLYVKGSMIAEEAFILIEDDWGDFVFEPDYPLMPLKELDTYLKQNKHLPDFPSAAEVKENGLALGETERLLTIKVEELTLYLLRMNEEMEALREEITTLKGEK